MVVSGLEVDEPKPNYTSSHPTPTLTLNTERVATHDATPISNSEGSGGIRGFLGVSSSGGSGPSQQQRRKHGNPRNPRSTVISQQQQQLMKNHLDSINDVAFLEVPYGMVVSVDRSGMVFIYQ